MFYKDCYFVAWAADKTGHLMIDELVQLAVSCEGGSFKQYIMPHRDLSYGSQRHSLLRTFDVTVSRNDRTFKIRVLKDLTTSTTVKTKTEVFALLDFLTFLEEVSNRQQKPLVFVIFDEDVHGFAVCLLLQALNRHLMLDRFKNVVKGFVNCRNYVETKCSNTVVPFSLTSLANVLLQKERPQLHSAANRAECTHEILIHLSTGDGLEPAKVLAANLAPAVQTVDHHMNDIQERLQVMRCQQSLRPIFVDMFRDDSQRQRGLDLRQILISAGVLLSQLEDLHENQEDLRAALKVRLPSSTAEDDISELVEVINNFFIHGAEEERPVVRNQRRPRYNRNIAPQSFRRPDNAGDAASEEGEAAAGPSTSGHGRPTRRDYYIRSGPRREEPPREGNVRPAPRRRRRGYQRSDVSSSTSEQVAVPTVETAAPIASEGDDLAGAVGGAPAQPEINE